MLGACVSSLFVRALIISTRVQFDLVDIGPSVLVCSDRQEKMKQLPIHYSAVFWVQDDMIMFL